ncbi:MAG: DUF1963 domain-containing protein [Clostridia bacterium]|nr:DUF1963 domain-containing protein [Clostridia bacterium]
MSAIRIKVKKAETGYDLGASKFFGTPTVPNGWESDFDEYALFFCQIRLADIAKLDRENRLPHSGYLYIFLDTFGGDYALRASVRYHDGIPTVAIDGFNGETEGYERFTDAWIMEFEETEEDKECTRLFGAPSDWNYQEPPPKLLLQFDPLDGELGFLEHLDGFLYFVFGEDERDFSKITLIGEYS